MFCPNMKGTGVDVQGGHAEYMLMNADATYLIPDKVSYEQAAAIFCAGYTVYSGLRWADPKPDERVAVLGIGGLGHMAVQYAKAAGFETIASLTKSLILDTDSVFCLDIILLSASTKLHDASRPSHSKHRCCRGTV